MQTLPSEVERIIDKAINKKYTIIVKDSFSFEALIQYECMQKHYKNLVIYTEHDKAYTNLWNFPVYRYSVMHNAGHKWNREKQIAKRADAVYIYWDGKNKLSETSIEAFAFQKKPIIIYCETTNKTYRVKSTYEFKRLQDTLKQIRAERQIQNQKKGQLDET